MKPTWLEEPQRGDVGPGGSRRNSANPFTADYTIDQTLHGLSSRSSSRRRSSRRLTIDVPPDYITLDSIATPGPSESTFQLDSPVGKPRRVDTADLALLSGPTLPLPNQAGKEMKRGRGQQRPGWLGRAWGDLLTFGKFVGPGFVIAVAYSPSFILLHPFYSH